MQRHTQEELLGLGIDVGSKGKSWGPVSEIVSLMSGMTVGEGLVIQKSEVKTSMHPVNYLRHRAKHSKSSPLYGWKFSVRTLPDKKGFAIIRVK